MDIFSPETLRSGKHRFRAPAMKTYHRIEVLFPNGACWYFDGSDLTPISGDAFEYDSIDEAAADYERLAIEGLNASIEPYQRIVKCVK